LEPVQLAGGVVLACGLVLRIVCRSCIEPKACSQHEARLRTGGPYRLVRHPEDSGALLAVLGQALVLGAVVGAGLGFAAMMGACAYRIELAERALPRELGTRYAEYKRRTAALVPFIW
jgi:protein-S-isoprenylcysteine O-methyltransferase Ste14